MSAKPLASVATRCLRLKLFYFAAFAARKQSVFAAISSTSRRLCLCPLL